MVTNHQNVNYPKNLKQIVLKKTKILSNNYLFLDNQFHLDYYTLDRQLYLILSVVIVTKRSVDEPIVHTK